ncbi:MAG: xanthine dehydrogenase family protein subunit M [Actinomycetota bacterium]|nr:xanthine dehydrogenase family protein subunit M [Actinomycetota bacterium]
MKPAPFEYVVAGSPAEAVSALASYEGDARILAGGQSLVPMLNMRLLRPAAVVDVNRIEGLGEVRAGGGQVRIGALARYATLEFSPVVNQLLPLLAEAVLFVGDRQVRNRGTMGGSLAQADPSGEMPLVALALGATVTVLGPGGERAVPAADLFLGPYQTSLEPEEMITEAAFPVGAGSVSALVEHVRRHGDFAVLAVAAVGEPGGEGRWRSVRLALAGVGPHAFVAEEASAMLSGTALEPEAVRAAGEACARAADPSSDVRASAEYRRHLVPLYVERVLDRLRERRAA